MISSRPVKMFLVFVVVLIAASAILSAFRPFSHTQGTPMMEAQPTPTISGRMYVDGYRGWTRVNPEPVVMPSNQAQLCAAPTWEQLELEKTNPHTKKFITVFVNDTGKETMMEKLEGVFPEGSVIVKEKLAQKNNSLPELLTVMIKRAPGYNPQYGDWEWMVVDGSATSVLARGKLTNCGGCHETYKGGDYVTRKYLPEEVRRKLK